MGHKEVQQFELGRPHVQRLLLGTDPMRDRIQLEPLHLDHLVHRGGRDPAHHRMQASSQLLGRERLGDVVIGPRLETADLVFFLATSGEHHHRDLAGHLILLELLDELDTAATGHHPVQHDEFGVGFTHLRQSIGKIFRLNRLVSLLLQHETEHFADRCLVLNHQNSLSHIPSLSSVKMGAPIIRIFCDTFMTRWQGGW